MRQPYPEPELDELYRELILDHYRHPRHHETLPYPDVVAEGYNPVCGDEVEMTLKFEGDRLDGIGLIARGCSISRASGSMMSDLVEGKDIAEIRRLSDEFSQMMTGPDGTIPEDLGDLEALQGVAKFAVRVKCATLPWHTLADGIAKHEHGDGTTRLEES
jgi:nitrogen fixation NifU-like protein